MALVEVGVLVAVERDMELDVIHGRIVPLHRGRAAQEHQQFLALIPLVLEHLVLEAVQGLERFVVARGAHRGQQVVDVVIGDAGVRQHLGLEVGVRKPEGVAALPDYPPAHGTAVSFFHVHKGIHTVAQVQHVFVIGDLAALDARAVFLGLLYVLLMQGRGVVGAGIRPSEHGV